MKTLQKLVGMKYHGTERIVASMADGYTVGLIREPKNEHDRHAIQVWADERLLGYLAKPDNRNLAIAMDLRAVTSMMGTLRPNTPERWPMVEVEEP